MVVVPSPVMLPVVKEPVPPESVNFDASATVTSSLKVSTIVPLVDTFIAPLVGVELLSVGAEVSGAFTVMV